MSEPTSDFLNFVLVNNKGDDAFTGTLKEMCEWCESNLGKNGYVRLDDDWEKEEYDIPVLFLLHGSDAEIIQLTPDQTRQFITQLLEVRGS